MSYTKMTKKGVTVKESASCFDTTRSQSHLLPGRHVRREEPIDGAAFTGKKPGKKPNPNSFLKRGQGRTAAAGRSAVGGGGGGGGASTSASGKVTVVNNKKKQKPESRQRRANPPNSAFRIFYERGDLPVMVRCVSTVVATAQCMCSLLLISLHCAALHISPRTKEWNLFADRSCFTIVSHLVLRMIVSIGVE